MLLYNHKLKPRARELRKNQTHAEILLWEKIKGRQVGNLQFLRQRPIGNFIVDFVCLVSKLVIEIDGPIHMRTKETDVFRQEQLELFGFRVLRFSNRDVEENIERVVEHIAQYARLTS
jgi:leucyl-tRNA synthetase